ncbi:MAG: hypothetical protein SWE60_03505 [Thermodesulfobacteriota bacterium]|nr:hypothetical protein [Thermodesulfobacteriota bacterium]
MRRLMIALGIGVLVCITAAGHAMELGDVAIHGFASAGYVKSSSYDYLVSSEDGSFEFNEAAVNFNASLTDDMLVGLQLYSFDLGKIGNNDVELDSAFVDYRCTEWLGVKAGKFKSPYGLYTEVQDYDMLRTSILLPQSVYNRFLRESLLTLQGADINGRTPVGSLGHLQYDVFVGTFEIDSDGGMAKVLASGVGEYDDATTEYAAGCRLKWSTPVDGLLLAATGGQFDMSYDLTRQTEIPDVGLLDLEIHNEIPQGRLYLCSAEYNKGNWTAAAEYQRIKADVQVNTRFLNAPLMPGMRQDNEVDYEGYYGLVSYRFNDWFEAGTYYAIFYSDADDRDGDERLANGEFGEDYEAWQKDLAFSTRFDINEYWLVKLEFHFIDGVALARQTEIPEKGFDDENWTLFAIKTTFNF